MSEDMQLWIAKDWWNVMAQGYGATIEAKGAQGFHYSACEGFLSFWAMKRWLRRQERRVEREYAEWPRKVEEMRRASRPDDG